jgi:gliding motility-associated-like protein
VSFVNHSITSLNSLEWDFGDGALLFSELNPTHHYQTFGSYPISLIVANLKGCTDTAKALLEIKPNDRIYIPNAFTPGNDAINNQFMPIGEGIKDFTIIIYNRWGQCIFNGSANQPWEGYSLGKHVERGIYMYLIKGDDFQNKSFSKTGTVMVLR